MRPSPRASSCIVMSLAASYEWGVSAATSTYVQAHRRRLEKLGRGGAPASRRGLIGANVETNESDGPKEPLNQRSPIAARGARRPTRDLDLWKIRSKPFWAPGLVLDQANPSVRARS